MSETFFSTKAFVGTWARAFGPQYRPLAIPIEGSGSPRTMHAIQVPGAYGLRHIELAPAGFYASPGWDRLLEPSTLAGILGALRGLRTRSFVWNVRFDHEPLAAALTQCGIRFHRTSAHVLRLASDYSSVFAGYNATTRRKIRAAHRRSVLVRSSDSVADLCAYYEIHLQRVRQLPGYSVFPMEFLRELITLRPITRFLVAEYQGRMAAGGIFLRDGCSVFYLHGAYDPNYSHSYPMCAVFDEAIRWSCSAGAMFFNFGGSGGIVSLERFKTFWGARPELNWTFSWTNPLWDRLSLLKAAAWRHLDGRRPWSLEVAQ